MSRLVVLLKRRPDLSVELFQQQLPGACAGLGSNPQVRRCILSLALPQGYAKAELLFDAILDLWRNDGVDAPGSAVIPQIAALTDEGRTVVMPVDVHVAKDGPIPPRAVKNIEFVNRRPGMPLDAFRSYWRDVHGPLAARIPVIRRYEQYHLAMSEYQGARNPAYDGLAVTWFASTTDMRQGTTTPEYAATRADEPNFLPDGHLPIIITRERTAFG